MTSTQLNLFYLILDSKNSWGKNEVRKLLLEVIAGIRTANPAVEPADWQNLQQQDVREEYDPDFHQGVPF